MKTAKTMLGKPLSAKNQETGRQAALIARRREQNLWRFVESLDEGAKFTGNRIFSHPVG